nr:ABC transporter permease [Planococcus glaciei]
MFYTNSFLLSLRKKEFGLYELIGAKKHQLKRVFLIETLSITAFALAVGLLLGFAFSGMVSALLMNQLNVEFTEFKVVYLPAVFWTSAYFLLAALITSSINSSKLAKASIIGLLQAAVQNDFIPEKPKKAAWPLIVLGFAFLSIGYAALFLHGNPAVCGAFHSACHDDAWHLLAVQLAFARHHPQMEKQNPY